MILLIGAMLTGFYANIENFETASVPIVLDKSTCYQSLFHMQLHRIIDKNSKVCCYKVLYNNYSIA